MARWREPVTDRTLSDIINRTSKAFMNIADWTRIRDNLISTKDLIVSMLGLTPSLNEISTPTTTQWVHATETNDMAENINALIEITDLPTAWIAPVDADYVDGSGGKTPDYNDINLWEDASLQIKAGVVNYVEFQIYCGVSQTGQTRFWQNQFRESGFAYVEPSDPPTRRPRTGVAECGTGFTRGNRFRRYA